jgi:cysteine desulfurase
MTATATIYCDYNATAPVRPVAAVAVAAALDGLGNPSSVHAPGRAAWAVVEQARLAVASLAGTVTGGVVFTSGATEANNLALRGFPDRRQIVSVIEHDSILAAVPDAVCVPVLADGRIDLDALSTALAGDARPALVSLMAANNETGVIQPIGEAVAIARRYGALVHCDAVQAAGRLVLAFDALDLDLMSLSAHKLGGPAGAGALVVREGLSLVPQIVGGGQEKRQRAGTENVPGIAGFGAVAAEAADDVDGMGRLAGLRDRFEAAVSAYAVVHGGRAPRLANTSCLSMPGVAAETQVMAFDLERIAVGVGSACSSGKVTTSHVLAAMEVAPSLADEAIRVSFGWASRAEDVDRLVDAWMTLHRRAADETAQKSAA